MTIYTKKGDAIKGDKIIAEARKMSKVVVIAKSRRHKSQKIVLRDNALCVIDKRIRSLK